MADLPRHIAIDDDSFHKEDGLFTPVVGAWSATKHRKLGYYCALFAGSMKKKWQCRIYLDLFAGAGKSRIRGKNDVIPGSPLLALSIKDPFDQYIFCEKDERSLKALEERVRVYFPKHRCHFILGDSRLFLMYSPISSRSRLLNNFARFLPDDVVEYSRGINFMIW